MIHRCFSLDRVLRISTNTDQRSSIPLFVCTDRIVDTFENIGESIDHQGEFESTETDQTFFILFEIQSHLIG
jgi:hypothetical protein